ncbi:MAG TPA: transglycosylase domain-containing protein [Candidatus Peribacteraceae bacterium]|nr:transglycosylase domain-containing protein [Candidatus Peribacteraceae bacterium]
MVPEREAPSVFRLWIHRIAVVFHSTLATAAALGFLLFLLLQDIWDALPDITTPQALNAEQSIAILDRKGNELYRIVQEEDRTTLERDEIPAHMRHAIIAIEDKRFYERPCIDVRALGRALWTNWINDAPLQGASTITQQLVRTAILSPEKTVLRKVRELMLACQLEHMRSKDDILDLYLNWISFGQNIYGVEQASKRFFGIPAAELSVAQAAVLASLPQRPTHFSPYGPNTHTTVSEDLRQKIRSGTLKYTADIPPEEVTTGLLGTKTRIAKQPFLLRGRANIVLEKMEEQSFISPEQKAQAEEDLLQLRFAPDRDTIAAPHFVFWIRKQLAELLEGNASLTSSGLKVHTTLDPLLQRLAEESVAASYPSIRQKYGAKNLALIAVDLRTNEIVAYVGNWNFFDEVDEGKIDMVQVPRQPGSSFKPFVYAAAFQNGYTPDSYVRDEPIHIGRYKPRNYEGGYFGRMKMRDALVRSRNIPAIKAFYWAGEEEAVLDIASALGITAPRERKSKEGKSFQYGWPLALGSAEVPLVQMAQGYATLAREGMFLPLISIRSIRDGSGHKLYAPERTPSQVISPQIARDLTSILSDTQARPEGYWRDVTTLSGTDAAVKTGTSSICTVMTREGKCLALSANDTWVIGYTPEILVAVWAGNADNTPLFGEADGLTVVVPLWRSFFEAMHAKRPPFLREFASD